jgi:hypothetical protein
VGDTEQWSTVVNTADDNRQHFCEALSVKTLFSALHGTYTVALQELKAVLKASTPAGQTKRPKAPAIHEDGFKEFRRRTRHSTDKTARTSKKAVPTAASAAVDTPSKEVATRKFFAPKDNGYGHRLFRYGGQSARRGGAWKNMPPIVITTATNLIQLQSN